MGASFAPGQERLMSLPHQKLVAWQRADNLFVEIHRTTLRCFPAHEKFELGSQIRRSAYSVPANIVEGTSRDTEREKLRFYNVASASLSETGYGLHAAHRLGYLDDTHYEQLEAQVRAVAAPLNGLIRKKRAILAVRNATATVGILIAAMQFMRWV
jgi:four helix bundle protein